MGELRNSQFHDFSLERILHVLNHTGEVRNLKNIYSAFNVVDGGTEVLYLF